MALATLMRDQAGEVEPVLAGDEREHHEQRHAPASRARPAACGVSNSACVGGVALLGAPMPHQSLSISCGAEQAVGPHHQDQHQQAEGREQLVLAAEVGAGQASTRPTISAADQRAERRCRGRRRSRRPAPTGRTRPSSTRCRRSSRPRCRRPPAIIAGRHPGEREHARHVDAHRVGGGLVGRRRAQRDAAAPVAEREQRPPRSAAPRPRSRRAILRET